MINYSPVIDIAGMKDVLRTYSESNLLNDLSTLTHEEKISLRNVLSKLNIIDISVEDIRFLKGLSTRRIVRLQLFELLSVVRLYYY